MSTNHYLAIDLGASSGRSIIGSLTGKKIEIRELTRFYNGISNLRGRSHWDMIRLFEEMKKALETCAHKEKIEITSMGIDTWGVDFGLLAKDGTLLSAPYAYRDMMTNDILEKYFKAFSKERTYELTGIQFMQFNTIFQLYALKQLKSPLLDVATDLLFIADIFHYWFTGIKKSEFSFATTSQLFNPKTKTWEPELFKNIGVSMDIMQEIIQPGTIIGKIDPAISKETGMSQIPVVAVATHDTGSAIAAIPAEGQNWAYISSGTWSLMGVESKVPVITKKSAEYNFTNEGGVDNTFRILKNIGGLFLLEQCKRAWAVNKNYEYAELVKMAQEAKPFQFLVDPDAPEFMNPINMPEAIAEVCKRTGQKAPSTHDEFARCVFDSLAFKYKYVLNMLKEISPNPIEKIHIIGGGSKNKFLCQLTADACGMPVIAGPAEGTALGNLLVQAMGMGQLKSLAEIREVIRNSFEFEVYKPNQAAEWDKNYQRFVDVIKR